jgi:fermentation-respiration switch protein FrsA (DUF1100 family)
MMPAMSRHARLAAAAAAGGLASAALLAAALIACSPVRVFEAGRLLREVAAGPALKGADAPKREAVAYRGTEQTYRADLYRPAEAAPAAALVLVPGLAPEGKDDPRFVALAESLARARFAVLAPDIASLRRLSVSAANVREIADSIAHLAGRDVGAEDPPLGVAAISYAVGPALLATLEPDVAGRIDFLVSIGGYHDIGAMLAYVTTGFYRDAPGGAWQRGRPNARGKWIFAEANAARLDEPRDRVTLAAIAGRRQADPAADIDDLTPLLLPDGRAALTLLTNSDPDRVPDLIAALPETLRADLAALDVKGRDLATAPAHLLLVHGRDDPVIPASESAALAAAAPPGRAHLYVVDNLAHVDLGDGGLLDALTLWRAAYRLLALRDGL